ncbi:hypothetical protein GN956_G15074 [Arapaima gigas]
MVPRDKPWLGVCSAADTSSHLSKVHKMFCSRCLLTIFVLYLLLEELSGFLLPDCVRHKREDSWLDVEFPTDMEELSPGDTAETARDWAARHSKTSTFLDPLERLSVPQHSSPWSKPKRKKISAPLDSIGGSFASSLQSRKDKGEGYGEHASE